jgi:hypothetical protein
MLRKELVEGRYVEETVRNALALLQGSRRVNISEIKKQILEIEFVLH